MGTMRYKPSDRVRIKSIDWYNENKNHCGEIPLFKPSGLFVPDMSRYCNNIMTIKDICYGTCYRMKEDFWNYNWTDEMIEGLVEDEISYDTESEWLKHEISLPEGYIFKDESGNVINATKIVLEKKKKELPKTYEECCEVLGHLTIDEVRGYKATLLDNLHTLLIYRDAYWKIAGEELGLGKPWEPDSLQQVFSIGRVGGALLGKVLRHDGNTTILEFPTREMRDAFYENFKEEIESCKELL